MGAPSYSQFQTYKCIYGYIILLSYKTLTLGQYLLLYVDYLIKAQQNPFRFIHFIDDKTEKQVI